ncbi:MAG: hypothetical protein NXI17_03105 [Alphaproteobacteria bacterium]|nr:hypothetical protein [Alphaproteobacteria bacterium]
MIGTKLISLSCVGMLLAGLCLAGSQSAVALEIGSHRAPLVTDLTRMRVELKGALLAKQVDSHLKQNDLALLAVGDFLSANPDISAPIAHSRMKRYQRAAAGLRSILAIAADGTLLFDSYNLPAPDINLGDRLYVREAVRQGSGDLRINPPVVGRQSGLPFIPITRGLFNVEGVAIGVVVGIMGPETLLPEDSNCALCVSVVLTSDMDVMVSRPSGLQLSNDLISHINDSMSFTGIELIDINGGLTLFTWTKNNYAGVITVVGELLPN